MFLYIDQTGHTIELSATPKRIVSLVPSQTELLADLGLEAEVVGITKFCIHPNTWFRNKNRVGGTKDVKPERVAALKPDLIIANKEENVKEQVEALRSIAPVWTSNIITLEDSFEMIHHLGNITDRTTAANDILVKTKDAFISLEKNPLNLKGKSCLYLIWKDPYMSVGADTFIHDMLCRCGLVNLLASQNRYPTITVEQIKTLSPEIILLSSEPNPFKEKHITALQDLLPSTLITLVDGEMFSWYGSRLMQAPAYFCGLSDRINSSSTAAKS